MEKELKLIPPTDPRVLCAISPFKDDMLKEHDIKDRKELTEAMFMTMKKYGGIGLTCNQVGLPFNMFVAGGHPQIENGMSLSCYNPMIISTSEEQIMMSEGCLTFPFLFLNIKRPRKCVLKYEDSAGNLQEAHLDGMMSRIVQHEMDHTLGKVFTDGVSKMKLDMAKKKAKKHIRLMQKKRQA